jgi:hypothetical protein
MGSLVDADDKLTQESPALAAGYEGAVTQRVGLSRAHKLRRSR